MNGVQLNDHVGRAIDTLLRSALMRMARADSVLQDRIDCAELALAAGEGEAARLLYSLVFLRIGFAPDAIAEQRAIAAASGLWREEDLPHVPPEPPLPTFSVDRAVAELKALTPYLPKAQEEQADHLAICAPEQESVGSLDARAPGGALLAEAAAACDRLLAALRQAQAADALAQVLSTLRTHLVEGPTLDPRHHVHDDLAQLAAVAVLGDLQRFLRDNHGLAYAPGGSPALLHAAARLSRAGLGPYLTNIRHIIRSPRDLFGLIVAASDVPPSDAQATRWANLLALHLDAQQLLDFIDELADRGSSAGLWAVFEARSRRASIWTDYGLVQRLRDCALDVGDRALAVRAQEMIVAIAARDPGELNVLATLLVNAGEVDRAEPILVDYSRNRPDDKLAATRLASLRAGDLTGFEVIGGLCTPPHRKYRRLQLWQPHLAARLTARAA